MRGVIPWCHTLPGMMCCSKPAGNVNPEVLAVMQAVNAENRSALEHSRVRACLWTALPHHATCNMTDTCRPAPFVRFAWRAAAPLLQSAPTLRVAPPHVS
jgi:hypothetical protein